MVYIWDIYACVSEIIVLSERSKAQKDAHYNFSLGSETVGLIDLASATEVARSQEGQSGGR